MVNEHKEEGEMLTVQEAAREAGISDAAIRSAILRGRLPFVQRYGRKLIRRADFDAYRSVARRGRPKKQDG